MMNTKAIDAIARAVLYEGYMLYPYRPSAVKNRQRFNFGVLYPRAYSEAQNGTDPWSMQTECLIEGSLQTSVEVKVRFLKLVARRVAPSFAAVDAHPPSWQEAVEREVSPSQFTLGPILFTPSVFPFDFPAETQTGASPNAADVTQVVRVQEAVRGVVQVSAEEVADGVFRLRVRVENLTAAGAGDEPREQVQMRSLVSAHTLLGVTHGRFVSLLDPPSQLAEIAAGCHNIGTWPVLVGAEESRDTMLSSPVILYDYPQLAPESPGDLFDGTEIDEILALRIMTLTEDEKREMRDSDDRARRILERTENLPAEHLMKLHGTLRELRPLKGETP